jgi:hypothetical protein
VGTSNLPVVFDFVDKKGNDIKLSALFFKEVEGPERSLRSHFAQGPPLP